MDTHRGAINIRTLIVPRDHSSYLTYPTAQPVKHTHTSFSVFLINVGKKNPKLYANLPVYTMGQSYAHGFSVSPQFRNPGASLGVLNRPESLAIFKEDERKASQVAD